MADATSQRRLGQVRGEVRVSQTNPCISRSVQIHVMHFHGMSQRDPVPGWPSQRRRSELREAMVRVARRRTDARWPDGSTATSGGSRCRSCLPGPLTRHRAGRAPERGSGDTLEWSSSTGSGVDQVPVVAGVLVGERAQHHLRHVGGRGLDGAQCDPGCLGLRVAEQAGRDRGEGDG